MKLLAFVLLAFIILFFSSFVVPAGGSKFSCSAKSLCVVPAGAIIEGVETISFEGNLNLGKNFAWFDYDSGLSGSCSKSFFDYALTSSFGYRSNPVSLAHETSFHYGVDYGLPNGTPVCAARGGKVVHVASGFNGGYGVQVVIQAPDGSCDSYNHLSVFGVKEGQKVFAGQLIAKSGDTGSGTGPHLHFARLTQCVLGGRFTQANKLFVNPLDYSYS